jgi:hypothetical protein
MSLYPEYEWDVGKFHRQPRSYWTQPDHLRKALENLGRELGIQKREDWYAISRRDFEKTDTMHLLTPFGNSIYKGKEFEC